ncbi:MULTISPECIES: CPBP family intramembrane glutamic endopeptidase [unclassified Clostridioides]|uniref:CPBP family intramembrane glutamic endopeptidase n=1 Tax=unclassified Clostridioides TaxID=2635829 RepID=UPI001D11383F
MFKTVFEDKEYALLCKNYSKNDGVKAIFIYLISMLLLFFQGYLYTTNLSSTILTNSQMILSILILLIGLGFVLLSKEKLNTIGITMRNLNKGLLYGVFGATVLVIFVILTDGIMQGKKVDFELPTVFIVVTFIVSAISEEIVFRGYIQTRLTGLIKNSVLSSCINSFLFVSTHYPVKWFLNGYLSFAILSGFYVICLILLHFSCDLVYRKTNCLWGSCLLHILYNIGTGMLIFTT